MEILRLATCGYGLQHCSINEICELPVVRFSRFLERDDTFTTTYYYYYYYYYYSNYTGQPVLAATAR